MGGTSRIANPIGTGAVWFNVAEIRCISCGYDLSAHAPRDWRGVVCPECGEADAARLPVPKAVESSLVLLLSIPVIVLSVSISMSANQSDKQSHTVGLVIAVPALIMAGIGCVRQAGRGDAIWRRVVGLAWLQAIAMWVVIASWTALR